MFSQDGSIVFSKDGNIKELSKLPYMANVAKDQGRQFSIEDIIRGSKIGKNEKSNVSKCDQRRQFSLEDIIRGSKIGRKIEPKDPPPSYAAVEIMENPHPGYYVAIIQKKEK